MNLIYRYIVTSIQSEWEWCCAAGAELSQCLGCVVFFLHMQWTVLKVGTSPGRPSKIISGMFRGTVGPKNKSIFSAGRPSPYWNRLVLQAFSWRATVNLNHHLPLFVFSMFPWLSVNCLVTKRNFKSLSFGLCQNKLHLSSFWEWINLVQTIVECVFMKYIFFKRPWPVGDSCR